MARRRRAEPWSLRFESALAASPEETWRWITSFEGIAREMSPWLRMSSPSSVRHLGDVRVEPGHRLFRSWIRLFGVLPVDYSDLTLMDLQQGKGFIEQSPMGSMKLWRHERRIIPEGMGCRLVDELTFEPRFLRRLTARVVEQFFAHRHRQLRRYLGGV